MSILLTEQEVAEAVGGVGMQPDYQIEQTWKEALQDYRAIQLALIEKLRNERPWAYLARDGSAVCMHKYHSHSDDLPLYTLPTPQELEES